MEKNLSSYVVQPYRRKYLKAYCERMSKDDETMLFDDNVASCLKEQGFSIEQEPRSVYRVEKLYEWLAKFAPEYSPTVNLSDEHVKRGIALAFKAFARPEGAPFIKALDFTPDTIYSITKNRKGSSGLTAWGVKKEEAYVRAYERGVQTLLGVKKSEPCIAFKRTQAKEKTRLIWGYPYSMTAIEGIFARPLINHFLKSYSPMAFGTTTGYTGAKLRVSSYTNRFCYSLDMTSFDSSIANSLIKVAFSILETWFDPNQKVHSCTDEFNLSSIYGKIIHYFLYTPIVMPDGNIYKGKRHGVPSGSYFTQMIDSIVNVIIIGTVSSKFHLNAKLSDVQVLGDDAVFWSDRDIRLSTLSDYASKTFGAVFNSQKCGKFKFNEPIKFLGRIWDKGKPDLPQSEIIKKMTQPERYRRYSEDPVERKRQSWLILASYAKVYGGGYRLFLRGVFGRRVMFFHTAHDLEEFVYYRTKTEDEQWAMEQASGLARYLYKYGRAYSGKVQIGRAHV